MIKAARYLAAYAAYGTGYAVYVVFEKCLPWGMPWPIYQTYNRIMNLSDDLQGTGPGPWKWIEPSERD